MRRFLPLGLLALAGGCGGSSSTAPTPPPPTTVATATTTVQSLLAELRDVRLEDGNRVVFTFSKPVAHARGRWEPTLHRDASGGPLRVRGSALLVLRFEPAQAHSLARHEPLDGKGPVVEVVEGGEAEGLVTWVIGADRRRRFELRNTGSRVVVSFGR